MYLIIEEGQAPEPYDYDAAGIQMTYCFLDADPVEAAGALTGAMRARWASGSVKGLLAAPFFAIIPYEWDRYLPTG